ncbi:MAG: CoA transferase [Deltaproteobacteria bacterium]|nr:CoA transferase [Deltaproteobacteria bacterium]
MTGPLDGVRVLDLSRLLPGPFCTQLLADLGAEVIKVEDPQGGDYLRWTPPLLDDGTSVLFHALNRGKKSVTLDLKTADGASHFRKLLGSADVVVESFRPGVMEKLGFSPDSMLREFPRLVVCSISGYGQSGPMRLRAGHDINYVARSGAYALMRAPVVLPVQVADLAAGAWPAAMQICAALVGRNRSGAGAVVDVSMKDGVTGLLSMVLARTLVGEDIAGGKDLLVGAVPCYGIYATSDGFLSVGALEPKFWAAFCAAIEKPELGDRSFDDDVKGILREILLKRSTAEWSRVFATVDACVEPVLSPAEALAEAKRIDVDVDGRVYAFIGLGLDAPGVTTRAPTLGQHNEELLGVVTL